MEVSRARKTLPRFMLTNWLNVIVRRYEAGYVKGRWVVQETPTEFTIQANVQPMKPSEIMLLPESERTREYIKVFVAKPDFDIEIVRTAREGVDDEDSWMADRVFWEGDEWEAMKEKHYKMGVLDHHVLYCARVPISAE